MTAVLLVALGGAMGAVLRLFVNVGLSGQGEFPFATLIVNLLGSLLIGVVAGWLTWRVGAQPSTQHLHWLLVTGILGAFTTFSAFSLDTVLLLQAGHWLLAGIYVLANVAGCLLLAALGVWLSAVLLR